MTGPSKVGSRGATKSGVVVGGDLEARGAMAGFRSGTRAENQHYQSQAGDYPGSRAGEQAHVKDGLRRDGKWGEDGTIRGFGSEREYPPHF